MDPGCAMVRILSRPSTAVLRQPGARCQGCANGADIAAQTIYAVRPPDGFHLGIIKADRPAIRASVLESVLRRLPRLAAWKAPPKRRGTSPGIAL
jgi:hypothetical protein